MDVDNEVEPTLREMARHIAIMRNDLLPALRQLDEDTVLSYYSVDEQARLYLSAAFTLALSLYSLDKITHRQVFGGTAVAARLTGAGTRSSKSVAASTASSTTDTQLVLKIGRITEYIKKLQEITSFERNKKLAAASSTATTAETVEVATTVATGKKRTREVSPSAATTTTTTTKKAKTQEAAEEGDEDYGDAQMFSVVSRVAGETGTLVSRLLKQVMTSKPE